MSRILKSSKGELTWDNKVKVYEVLKKYTMVIVLVAVVVLFAVNTEEKCSFPRT